MCFTAQPQKIFDPPTSDSTFSTESSAVLTWQFPGGSVNHYVIEYVLAQDSEGFASSNATIKTANESQTSTVIRNLLPGAIYKFRVAVMNNLGTSQFSECGVFQTVAMGESIDDIILTLHCSALDLQILHFAIVMIIIKLLQCMFFYFSVCSSRCSNIK